LQGVVEQIGELQDQLVLFIRKQYKQAHGTTWFSDKTEMLITDQKIIRFTSMEFLLQSGNMRTIKIGGSLLGAMAMTGT
tara:strand:- start:543 stop:779 length:237 start_codon:yes stop_codon:yes gene_type:complete